MCTVLSTLVLVLLFLLCASSSTAQHRHNRRVLHQPLFPRVSAPTIQPPAPSPEAQPKQQKQQPKLPFDSSSSSSSSSPPQKPFFPSFQTPTLPPSTSAVLPTFPANISSLLLPRPNSHTHRHTASVAVAVTLSLLSLAIISAAAVFALRRRNPAAVPCTGNDDKASRSDSLRLFPPNAAASDGGVRKPRGKMSPRSEILYLGTVASSEAADSSCSGNGDFRPPYQKLGDSPELNPLPPLPRYNFRAWTSEHHDEDEIQKNEEENEDEQFFSPRASSDFGNREKQSPTLSPQFLAATSSRSIKTIDRFGCRSFTSRTPSYPRSNSLSSSTSRSPSLNLSPASLKSTPPHHNPASPSFSSSSVSLSPNPRTVEMSSQPQATKLPPHPPPPPPPPPRFWDFAEPSQNVVGESKNKNENEETPKPKLKALHWDKVKASSDRAMVWDRLRPSSFQ